MRVAIQIADVVYYLGMGSLGFALAATLLRDRRNPQRESEPPRRGAGWQKPVSPPPEGSRPAGLPPRTPGAENIGLPRRHRRYTD